MNIQTNSNGFESEGDFIERMKVDCRQIIATTGVSQKDLAQEFGIAPGTFGPFLSGKYLGVQMNVANAIQKGLETRAAIDNQRSAKVRDIEFIETKVSRQVSEVFQMALWLPSMVSVVGTSGVGKTQAIAEFIRKTPNTWLATMNPMATTRGAFLGVIFDALGLIETRNAHLFKTVVDKLKSHKNAVLIIDDAQFCNRINLDLLRCIHDQAGVGIALVGNEKVTQTMQTADSDGAFAQFQSRVSTRLKIKESSKDYITVILDFYGIENADIRKSLYTVGRMPGCLRNIRQVFQLATMVAFHQREALTPEHINIAYANFTAERNGGGHA